MQTTPNNDESTNHEKVSPAHKVAKKVNMCNICQAAFWLEAL